MFHVAIHAVTQVPVPRIGQDTPVPEGASAHFQAALKPPHDLAPGQRGRDRLRQVPTPFERVSADSQGGLDVVLSEFRAEVNGSNRLSPDPMAIPQKCGGRADRLSGV
jgi:hypothetical protein